MKINKKHSMLLDVQYIRPRKENNNVDYIYIIWKDLEQNEKHLMVIPEPSVKIYFEKPEARTHDYNLMHTELSKCDAKVVRYKDIVRAIAEDMGESGISHLNDCFMRRDYRGIKEFLIYPYVFGADADIRVLYRYMWYTEYDNEKPKVLRKAFYDIEVDIMGSVVKKVNYNGTEPVDLITYIDNDTNRVYTFALIGVDAYDIDKGMPFNENPPYSYVGFNHDKYEEVRPLYDHRLKEQEYWSTHIDEFLYKAHEMFDENYPDFDYTIYFYKDERMMLVHFFQMVNKLTPDFLESWTYYDIRYLMARLQMLGLDPAKVICHPDFPVKECYFKEDHRNFTIKNKSDYFCCSSYTIYADGCRNYAAIRKGGSELRSTALTEVARAEIGDEKLDYSDIANIKTLSYSDYLMYILYNIKDVLLTVGIERATGDLDTYYASSYLNLTPYENEFKQIPRLTAVRYRSFLEQGFVPGENENGFYYNYDKSDDDDEDEESSFEGALVGNPKLIDHFGVEIFGNKTNAVFQNSIDFDMKEFYPRTIREFNIDASTLIFKMIVDPSQYDVRGGDLPFNGVTHIQLVKENDDSFVDDVGKEVMDNFLTKNYIYTGEKWMNLPTIADVWKKLKKEGKR